MVEVVPALLIALAVAGVAVGAWALNRTTAATVAASGGPADGAGAGPGPDATASSSSRPTASTPTATTPTASSSPPSGTVNPVDRSVPVTVLNGTQRSGLAGRAARPLRATGWTVRVGNERTTRPTTVVYPSGAQQATAQALAADLGGSPALEQSGRYGGTRLTVLLGTDYAG